MNFFIIGIQILYVLLFLRLSGAGVVELARMVRFMTGIRPINVARYGNFCGVGGQGMPVDLVDRCCLEHDDCYGQVMEKYCLGIYGILIPFQWSKVTNGTQKSVSCEKNTRPCPLHVCGCDRDLTACLRDGVEAFRHENVRNQRGLFSVLT